MDKNRERLKEIIEGLNKADDELISLIVLLDIGASCFLKLGLWDCMVEKLDDVVDDIRNLVDRLEKVERKWE